jgi:hypothetical protein
MNAYLFTGCVSQYNKGNFSDFCSTLIVYGADEEASWKSFEKWLLRSDTGEDPISKKVEKIVGAPFLDQLFTETGFAPLDWDDLWEEAERIIEGTDADETGQGYWVDGNQCVNPNRLAGNLDSLQRDLPEEISSGLNWSPDKNYFFVLSVLSPLAPRPALVESPETDDLPLEEDSDGLEEDNLNKQRQLTLTFPGLAEKRLAVMLRARNSVIAAWLWRKYAATTPLAANDIRIEAWCGAMSPANAEPTD